MMNPFTSRNAVNFLVMTLVILGNVASSLAAAPAIPFTVTMSEAVNVTGTPRLVLDVGGTTRYATYNTGTGTASLTFTYTATLGDLDLDGIGIASTTLDLNGGNVTDINGNPETNLSFVAPANMNSVKVSYPSLSMDFTADADGRYTLNGTAYNDITSFLSATGGTFSRAGAATYFDSAGMLQTAAANVPRFDYDPTTLAAKGVLIEESRTNLAFYSNDPLQWVNNGATLTSTGTTELGMFSSISVASTGQVWNRVNMRTNAGGTGSALSANPTVTFYYKTGTSGLARITVYNSTQSLDSRLQGTPGSLSVVVSGAGAFSNIIQTQIGSIHVVSFTFTPLNNTDLHRFGIGPGTSVIGSNIIILGGQIEYGTFPTSFIPTTVSTVVRPADSLYIPTGTWTSVTGGTIYARADYGGLAWPPGVGGVFALNDNTTSNRVDLRAGQMSYFVDGGGSGSTNFPGSFSFAGGLPKKFAITYSASVLATSFEGASATNAAPVLPSGLSRLWIGNIDSGVYWLNGHVAAIKYYPNTVSNTQLQLLTQ